MSDEEHPHQQISVSGVGDGAGESSTVPDAAQPDRRSGFDRRQHNRRHQRAEKPDAERRSGLDRRVAEQAVVAVEARQDRARDLGGEVYAAASFGFFCESKNCSSSVEPCSAVVDALPPVTTWVISSK